MDLYNDKFKGRDCFSLFNWYKKHGLGWVRNDIGMTIPLSKFMYIKTMNSDRYYKVNEEYLLESLELIYNLFMKYYIMGDVDRKTMNKFDPMYNPNKISTLTTLTNYAILRGYIETSLPASTFHLTKLGIDFIDNYDILIEDIKGDTNA